MDGLLDGVALRLYVTNDHVDEGGLYTPDFRMAMKMVSSGILSEIVIDAEWLEKNDPSLDLCRWIDGEVRNCNIPRVLCEIRGHSGLGSQAVKIFQLLDEHCVNRGRPFVNKSDVDRVIDGRLISIKFSLDADDATIRPENRDAYACSSLAALNVSSIKMFFLAGNVDAAWDLIQAVVNKHVDITPDSLVLFCNDLNELSQLVGDETVPSLVVFERAEDVLAGLNHQREFLRLAQQVDEKMTTLLVSGGEQWLDGRVLIPELFEFLNSDKCFVCRVF